MESIPEYFPSKEKQEIPGTVSEQKAVLRRRIKQRLAALPEEERRQAGENCARQFWQLPELSRCRLLLSYVSHAAELPTDGIIAEALGRGIRVAVPCVTGRGTMEFYEIQSLSDCRPGAFGILEPPADPKRLVLPGKPRKRELLELKSAIALLPGKPRKRELLESKSAVALLPGKPRKRELLELKSAVALLPGLAFTEDGIRLGYGGGYYDRYFSRYPEVYRIGLSYRFALLEWLPWEPHDICADTVITPVSF